MEPTPTPPPPAVGPGYGTATGRRRGIATGLAVSLLLHGALIVAYRQALPPAIQAGAPAATMVTVWLHPTPPRIPPAPPPEPEPLAQQLPPPPKPAARPPRKQAHPPVPGTAQAPGQPAPAPQASPLPAVDTDTHAPEERPKFDMEAARRTARRMASEPDPNRAGKPVAQLDGKPLYPKSTESKLARDMAEAKRADCKDGIPGGLLAPLLLLFDKKDGGCKW